MKVIGITGGIGSGKSLVANILKDKYGAYIVNTDKIAKEQMEPKGISYPGVVSYFGSEILSEEGFIDSKKLSEIVFADNDKLHKLNQLTHPNVLIVVEQEKKIIRESGLHPYFIIETALMIESGYASACDEVWYVQASPEERRNRLKKNRGYLEDKINTIFASQSKDEDFLCHFSIVITNNSNIKDLEIQVDHILNK
ncbi:MAG TPA: dephospho-CoA kinase [Mobilitalea sp.]|nr:dephospho-CoA kinase [Mobilitalea sp.]